MDRRRRETWFLALVTALLLVGAACSGDDDGGQDGETGGTAGQTGGTTGFQPRDGVEIPQTDDMVETSEYVTEAPWVIGYADASLSNSARVFIWQFAQWAASEYPQIEDMIQTNANDPRWRIGRRRD